MTLRSEADIFVDLERLCGTPGYIHVFASLVVKNTFVPFAPEGITGEDFEKTFSDGHLIRTELCTLLGLMLKSTVDFARPKNEKLGEMEAQTLHLLEGMHRSLGSGMRLRSEGASQDPHQSIDLGHGETLREPIFYTGESAYASQYRDLAPLKYEQDSAWIESHRGFTIAQAANVGRAIFELQGKRVSDLFNSLRSGLPEDFTFMPAFTFTVKELLEITGEEESVVSKVLGGFSVPEGDRNGEFKALNDFNLANAQPILRKDGESFICFQKPGDRQKPGDKKPGDKKPGDRNPVTRNPVTDRTITNE